MWGVRGRCVWGVQGRCVCGVALCVRDVRHAHAKQDNERQEALLAAEEQKLIQMEEELKEAKVRLMIKRRCPSSSSIFFNKRPRVDAGHQQAQQAQQAQMDEALTASP